jgi:tetratricopeptide (TPR) repeat protein
MRLVCLTTSFLLGLSLLLGACKPKSQATAPETGPGSRQPLRPISVCGPAEQQFGKVAFGTSCPAAVQADFTLALALLHSFEYEAAEKVFTRITEQAPGCAMAYWGIAMANYHPLWTPPTPAELAKGARAVARARELPGTSAREAAYIRAIAAFYQDHARLDHRTRSLRFEAGMAAVHRAFPADPEASIFYALALNAAADPADKSFRKQRQAGALLAALYPQGPDHPGIVHYLIHTYDYPELAAQALPAARRYAAIAPSSAHAQHMPSHIFTRLGLWAECIASNEAAAASARCYAENAGLPDHWDEELHAIDYLAYAHLQRGDNRQARAQWRYLTGVRQVTPMTFKVAYAFAAVPARYVLENRQWAAAARLQPHRANLDWQKFPWQRAITHFARALGAARTGQLDSARADVQQLAALHDTLSRQQDAYKAQQVQIQRLAATAWLRLAEGDSAGALARMRQAAALEDQTEKHPVTPGEVLPARELLADMLLQLGRPVEALAAYQATLRQHPNRFNALYGAAVAAERSQQPAQARSYYQQLVQLVPPTGSPRPELAAARAYLARQAAVAS